MRHEIFIHKTIQTVHFKDLFVKLQYSPSPPFFYPNQTVNNRITPHHQINLCKCNLNKQPIKGRETD